MFRYPHGPLDLPLVPEHEALAGRSRRMPIPSRHVVLGSPLDGDFTGLRHVLFGMGCFWGAERRFWELPGVHSTAVGYAGGFTPNPTYEEVCSGRTGHAEVVRVVFDPSTLTFEALLGTFWESHDPTQGMRQGNDLGTQYRSAVYASDDDQLRRAEASRDRFAEALRRSGFGSITTEIRRATSFYFAEEEHQQYLAKHPRGYCGLGGTGVRCPTGLPDPSSSRSA